MADKEPYTSNLHSETSNETVPHIGTMGNGGFGFSYYFLVCEGSVTVRFPSIPMSPIRAEQKAELLLQQMRIMGYSAKTIEGDQWFSRLIRREFSVSDDGLARLKRYQKVYSRYSLSGKNGPELAIVRRWMLFDLYDQLPSLLAKRAAGTNTINDRLCPPFRDAMDRYAGIGRENGLRESTIRVALGSLGRFLIFVQEEELVHDLDIITELHIRHYKESTGISNAVLHRIGRIMDDIGAPCAPFFPGPRGLVKTIYEGLSTSEITTFKEFVHSSKDISHRDKAICLILIYFGIRNSDLRGLRVDQVHWDSNCIAFRQKKTGQYVSYPLLPEVGDAIRQYIDTERPNCDAPYLFISEHCRVGHYACVEPDKVVNRVYALCGIRHGNAKKGTHILRHALGTALLNEGEDLSLIADVLGHSHVQSSMAYLSSSIDALRRCGLDVTPFPVNAKIFEMNKL